MSYVSLHNHYDTSLFDGYMKYSEGISRAKELGQTALSITDHGTMSGVIPFYKECIKQGIKPIIGMEAYFVVDASVKERGYFHLLLLAKNNTGYHNLMKLDTLAYENLYYKPRIDINMLKQYHEGLICTSACVAGPLKTNEAESWAVELQQIFGNDFYIEIQPNSMPEQKEYNYKILAIAEKYALPIVVTTDAHYARSEDAKYHRLWVNINKDENEYYQTDDYYIMSDQEVFERLSKQGINPFSIDLAIANTGLIVDQCDVTIEVKGNHYPVFPTDDPVESVKEICRQGWKDKIMTQILKDQQQKYLDRFLYEMSVLEKLNYLNYLLILHDILGWCKSQDIMVGPGRGSSAGSLVCYLMNITQIDPIKHNLLFERFANPDRVTPADIDSDIPKSRRQEVINYVRNKYGDVYNVRTFGYLGVKGAIQRAGQALKMEAKEYMALSKNRESFDTIQGYDELVDIARHFEERLESFGCHASAVMIFNDDPLNYCPIEKQKDNFLVSYDYHDLEAMNLLKLDLLGIKTIDAIQETLSHVDEKIDVYRLPLEDAETYKVYSSGTTSGTFQTESTGMRFFAKQMNVDRFDDIVALVALYRPGPLDSGMAQGYIDGKNGAEVKYLHPSLEPILKDTFSTLCYQEQVIEIVKVMAAMTPGEADNFRKVIGRKELDKIESIVKEFIERSVANGYERSIAEEMGRQIQACGRYIFNRSHAAAYAYVSYITAYLKTKYPLEYMKSLLNSEIGGERDDMVGYIRECKRLGISILPPSIQHSGSRFTIEDGAIRFGLNAIKGVGGTEFVQAESFDEFVLEKNPNVNKGTLEALIKAGAFPEPRGLNLAKLAWLQTEGKKLEHAIEKLDYYEKMFDSTEDQKERAKALRGVNTWNLKIAAIPPFDNVPLIVNEPQLEREVLGMYLTSSPMDLYAKELTTNTWSWEEFLEAGKGSRVIAGGMVKKIKPYTDKKGRKMAFVDMEYYLGDTISATFFASDWEREGEKFSEDSIIRVEGTKDVDNKMLGKLIAVLR
ncbi:MAG: DNA polymerase III subunit alpha [Bacteroidota bacterium]|nr:DNA polymerase III subunit alpha [Bacteroidota bacterium]